MNVALITEEVMYGNEKVPWGLIFLFRTTVCLFFWEGDCKAGEGTDEIYNKFCIFQESDDMVCMWTEEGEKLFLLYYREQKS